MRRLPPPISHVAQRVRRFALRGSKFYCPLCDQGYRKFLPAGVVPRPGAQCPVCHSLERHRALWVVLEKLWGSGELGSSGVMLHVAPEQPLAAPIQRSYDYISIDLDGARAMQAMDITSLTFPDATFDAIICNHVLEHVPDDRKAMAELYRVLKPGGWGSIQVPMKGAATDEDLSITDPAERRRRYGQEDHVRQYGQDYKGRLSAAGFHLLEISLSLWMAHEEIDRLSLAGENEVLLVRKPAPGI